jgi:3-oxoacyl-[acyl-carrier protein] reductase
MLFSLEGYGALVTGASGSIGRAIALSLATQGASLVISGTKQESLKSTKDEIKSRTGKEAVIIECDLSNILDVKNLVNKAEDFIGHVDILVNNAGINKDMLFMRMNESDLEDVLDINLKAPFILSKEAVLKMAKRKFGRIINITSVVGFTGNPGQVNYCASKAGIVGMSKAISLEYSKKGVTVNCIAPGAIRSPMIDKLSAEAQNAFLNKIPMGVFGDPEDIAYACCYLASKEASYITGQTLHINGGMFIA